ncbi:MAG: hypothetical protein ACI4WG_03580 [Erysipelotrichaceae bacterium]
MTEISKLINEYGYKDGWKKDIETILKDFGQIFTQVLDGSGYYAYRNPTIGEKNINISKNGVKGSTKNNRIMWIYPKKKFKNMDMGINRDLFAKISMLIDLPEPREVKPGRCVTEWVIRIDLSTALKVCEVFCQFNQLI